MIVKKKEIKNLKANGLWRLLCDYRPTGPVTGVVDGRPVVNFGSNNYLGLTHHSLVIKAAEAAVIKYGAGSGASRLVSGNNLLYSELERGLAGIKGAEAALVFTSGYQANLGVITALASRNDLILSDRLNHASLIDGALMSKAKVKRYAHNDTKALERILRRNQECQRKIIITDAVFSMDGELAPLADIALLAHKYDAILMVDDAHGTGVLGKHGAGAADYLGVKDIPVQIGTLSKALGSLGGFVTGSTKLISYLLNKSRSLIYSTALPPAVLAAAIAAVDVLIYEPELQLRLRENIIYFKRGLRQIGFDCGLAPTPIVPIIIGEPEKAQEVSALLLANGIYAPAIRPPTVPKGTSRLRITLSACHKRQEMDKLLDLLETLDLGK